MANGQIGLNVPSHALQGKKKPCNLELVAALGKTVQRIVLGALLVILDSMHSLIIINTVG